MEQFNQSPPPQQQSPQNNGRPLSTYGDSLASQGPNKISDHI